MVVRTFGGKHVQCFDVGEHVPATSEGSRTSQREPDGRFHALAHLIDVPALARAYYRLRPEAAAGVDGITKEDYGQNLLANLQELHERLKSQR